MQNITVKGKEIRIKDDRFVIESENKAELVEFTVMDAASIEGLSDMVFYVQYRNKLEEVGMDILEKDVVGDTLLLDWLPSASFTKERGPVEIQIIGFSQSLVTTSDATYQSGKLYFDADGNFIAVYPADSTHSPKVGDTITGTVKENQETGDDHRWSTIKVHLFLPEDIYENGTPVYTEAQVESLITQIQAEIALAQGYVTSAANSATAASGSASAASGSASSANTNALKAEGFAVGQQGGSDVTSGSPYYHNNAKYYSDEASASATAASASAGSASQSATTAVNAMIASVSETISPDDGGTNTITITYKDGSTKTFTVKNGKAGTPFEIYKTYASISAMNADFDNVPLMKMVCISSNTQDPDNGKLYVRGEEQFEFITDMSGAQGIQGPDGLAATIAVGTVSTGAAGSSATVTNSGTSSAAVFDFSIPKGDTGASGAAATIAVGTVTAGDDPSDASVTNSGTSSAAVFDFVLPKGETGNTPLLSIGDVTYGDTPTVTIDTTDPDNPVLDFVLKTSEVGVVDNLTSDSQVDALSAKQGKVLKGLTDSANSRINQHDARLENLEQKAGDYGTWHYPNDPNHSSDMPNKVPTGKAKNGLVEKIVGKTRAWNQMIPSLTASNFTTGSIYSSSLSNDSDGNLVATSVNGIDISCSCPFVSGRKYLVSVILKSSISGNMAFFADSTNLKTETISSANTYQTITEILSPNANTAKFRIVRSASASETLTVNKWLVRDLTLIFGAGNEPSTVADALAQLPALGQYNAYDAGSLVSTEVSGVKSVGVNIWDEEWEVGSLNLSTGANNDSVSNKIRSKNYIPLNYGKEFYVLSLTQAIGLYACIYDENKNFLSARLFNNANGLTITPTSVQKFMRFYTAYDATSYSGGIQICLNSYADKTTYHPYMTDTLSLSETVTLRSAGNVAEVLNVESGMVTHPIGSVDLGSLGWTGSDGKFYAVMFGMKSFSSNNPRAICAKYALGTYDEWTEKTRDRIILGEMGLNVIYIYDSRFSSVGSASDPSTFLGQLQGVYLNYQLTTPDASTFIDPITENFIEVEGGGTINTIQEQSPVIDNCLDVGYLTV